MPLFPGDCELRQLLHIFKLLGTPKEDEWAGVSQLRDWHEFPNWRPQSLEEHFPTLEPAGVDLMRELFIYDPAMRITVSAAHHLARLFDIVTEQAVCPACGYEFLCVKSSGWSIHMCPAESAFAFHAKKCRAVNPARDVINLQLSLHQDGRL